MVWIYARVSSVRQTDGMSIAAQIAACQTYSDQQAWDIVEVVSEVASSWKSKQKILDITINKVRRQRQAGTIAKTIPIVILVAAADRFGRQEIDWTVRRGKMAEADIWPMALDVTGSPFDRYTEYYVDFERKIAIGQAESSSISRRSLAYHAFRRANPNIVPQKDLAEYAKLTALDADKYESLTEFMGALFHPVQSVFELTFMLYQLLPNERREGVITLDKTGPDAPTVSAKSMADLLNEWELHDVIWTPWLIRRVLSDYKGTKGEKKTAEAGEKGKAKGHDRDDEPVAEDEVVMAAAAVSVPVKNRVRFRKERRRRHGRKPPPVDDDGNTAAASGDFIRLRKIMQDDSGRRPRTAFGRYEDSDSHSDSDVDDKLVKSIEELEVVEAKRNKCLGTAFPPRK